MNYSTEFILLFCCFSAFDTLLAFTYQNCIDGSWWVENFMRFECFDNLDGTGVEITACVPSNENDGIEYRQGRIFDHDGIRSQCIRDERNRNFLIIKDLGCITLNNQFISPYGRQQRLDGSYYECLYSSQGKLQRKFYYTSKCLDQNGNPMNLGDIWNNTNLHVSFNCVNGTADGDIQAEVHGCLYHNSTVIRNDVNKINDTWYQCKQDAFGFWTVYKLPESKTSCTFDEMKFELNKHWSDENQRYKCSFVDGEAVIHKKGCVFDGVLYHINETRKQGEQELICDMTMLGDFYWKNTSIHENTTVQVELTRTTPI